MLLNRSLFEEQHGYNPSDESIPHLIQFCNLHGVALKEIACTSYENALKSIQLFATANPKLAESTVIVCKIINVSVQDHPKHISRVSSYPDSICN